MTLRHVIAPRFLETLACAGLIALTACGGDGESDTPNYCEIPADDEDRDGYCGTYDCDEADANTHAYATDPFGDGGDENCDGADGVVTPSCSHPSEDTDVDGYCGVDDCNSNDAAVHVGAEDPRGDGVDTDCDGIDG